MKTMERIVREQLSSEVILILMHVVIFSADGLGEHFISRKSLKWTANVASINS